MTMPWLSAFFSCQSGSETDERSTRHVMRREVIFLVISNVYNSKR